MTTNPSRIYRLGLFLVLPLFYLWLSFTFLDQIKLFYLEHNDPVYPYLINGTNLAGKHLEIGHTDHPGTPMQCFAAIVIYVKHLIAGSGMVYQDVILHPENYLHVICICLMMLLGLVTFLTAIYVYRQTHNIRLALFFQLTPLFNCLYFYNGTLPISECFIIIGSTFFMAYIYVNSFVLDSDKNIQGTGYRKYIVFGILSGLLISSKITTAPLVIMCLFLTTNRKQVITYLVSTTVAFFIFIFPAISKIKDMYLWVISLFMHEDIHGFGKTDIVNPREFKIHLLNIFKTEFIFTLIYSITSIAMVFSIIASLKKIAISSAYKRGITGLWLTFTLLILMVAKHYLFAYLIPVQCCFALALVISWLIFSSSIKTKLSHSKSLPIFFSIVIFIILAYKSIAAVYGPINWKHHETTKQFIDRHSTDAIITTNPYRSCFVEPSLYFGIIYAGRLRPDYFSYTMKIYPNTFFFNMEDKNLIFWDIPIIPMEILKHHNKVLVEFNSLDTATESTTMNYLCNWNGKKIADYSKVFEDTVFKDAFYEINTDTTTIAKMFSKTLNITCDMEKPAAIKSEFLTNNVGYLIKNSGAPSTEEYYSGNTSLRLSRDAQYGMNTEFPVSPGNLVTISVWKKNLDNKAFIVLESDNGSFYANSRSIVSSSDNGWDQLFLRYQIPADYKGKTAKFYINYTGNKQSFMDDLEINVYQIK